MTLGLDPVDGDLPPEIAVIEVAPGVRVIKVGCELDMLSTPSLSHVLTEQLGQQPVGVIVDLSDCRLLSAKGLTALEAAHERVGPHTLLILAGAKGVTARILRVCELDVVILTYPTLDDAVHALVHPH